FRRNAQRRLPLLASSQSLRLQPRPLHPLRFRRPHPLPARPSSRLHQLLRKEVYQNTQALRANERHSSLARRACFISALLLCFLFLLGVGDLLEFVQRERTIVIGVQRTKHLVELFRLDRLFLLAEFPNLGELLLRNLPILVRVELLELSLGAILFLLG